MSELPNRDDLEADFAKRFGRLARRHMREFRELLGDPPNMDNVPQEFWDKMQHEVNIEAYFVLLLIFDESAIYHGWTGPSAGLASYGWATAQAATVASNWVGSTQARLTTGLAKLTNPQPPAERTVEEAKETNLPVNRIAPYLPRVPAKEEVDDLIKQTFGPSRIETTAIDETTRARHAGAEAAVEATVGLSVGDEWRVEETANGQPDDRVCPICEKLNRTRREDWPWRYSEGPPAHFRCRCHIEHLLITPMEAVGRMLDDEDYKSLRYGRKRFDRKAWFRTIPNAAEWRAHCRENDFDIDDRSEFKAFNRSEERADDGKWTSGGTSEHQPAKPSVSPVRLLTAMHKIEPRAGSGALVSVRDLRKQSGLGEEELEHAIVSLSRQGILSLHRHDYPASLSQEQREEMLSIPDKDGYRGHSYIIGVNLRQHSKSAV